MALLRSELLKQRSTRTLLGLFAAMLGLVLSPPSCIACSPPSSSPIATLN